MFQVKDSAIFLGCLYFVVFIVLLPEFIVHQKVASGLSMVLLGATSVLIVHLISNWLYVAVVMVPLVMAAVFFVAGCSIWLFTPVVLFAIEGVIQIVIMFFGGNINLSLLSEFFTRFGQFLMIVSGALWWVVNKGKELNYKALIVYIVILVLLGVLAGMTSFARLAGFLFIWLVVYSKVKGDENMLMSIKNQATCRLEIRPPNNKKLAII